MQASPELLRFSMWPLFHPLYRRATSGNQRKVFATSATDRRDYVPGDDSLLFQRPQLRRAHEAHGERAAFFPPCSAQNPHVTQEDKGTLSLHRQPRQLCQRLTWANRSPTALMGTPGCARPSSWAHSVTFPGTANLGKKSPPPHHHLGQSAQECVPASSLLLPLTGKEGRSD